MNDAAFDVDSEESFYWAGFMMADGCISVPESDIWDMQKGVILQLARKDEDHLIKYKKFIGSEHAIQHCMTGDGDSEKLHPSSRLSVVSSRLSAGLARFGVIPDKTLRFSVLPDAGESRHFWRGLIDADGCIHDYRGNGSLSLNFLGSSKLCDQFSRFCYSCSDRVKVYKRHRTGECWAIDLHGVGAWEILKILYEDSNVYMQRKKDKALMLVEYFKDNKWKDWTRVKTKNLVDRNI